jgi:homoserine O-acetyltransferase
MSALLTYRSRDSFESRFGRNFQDPKKHSTKSHLPIKKPLSLAEKALLMHNDGHKSDFFSITNNNNNSDFLSTKNNTEENIETTDTENNDNEHSTKSVPHVFSAQSYLRYQGDKFINRFDANCYISLTRKMDSHDIGKDRGKLEDVLSSIQQQTLVIGKFNAKTISEYRFILFLLLFDF